MPYLVGLESDLNAHFAADGLVLEWEKSSHGVKSRVRKRERGGEKCCQVDRFDWVN